MKLNKIEPKFIKKNNPRIGLITLASDFRIEKDFNDIIYGKDIDLVTLYKCDNTFLGNLGVLLNEFNPRLSAIF